MTRHQRALFPWAVGTGLFDRLGRRMELLHEARADKAAEMLHDACERVAQWHDRSADEAARNLRPELDLAPHDGRTHDVIDRAMVGRFATLDWSRP